MTFRQNTAEGQTSGAALTAANSGGGSGDAFNTKTGTGVIAFSSAQSAHGTQSYLINETTLGASVAWSGMSGSDAASRAYVRWVAVPTALQDIMFLDSPSGTILVRVTSAGLLRVANIAGTTLFTFASAFATGQWYRVEVRAVAGTTTTNGTISCAYYLGDSTTPVETAYLATNVNAGTAAFTGGRYMKLTSAASHNAYWDDLAFSDAAAGAFIGPPATAVPRSATGSGQGDGTAAGSENAVTSASGTSVSSGTAMVTVAVSTSATGTGSGAGTTSASSTSSTSTAGTGTGAGVASATSTRSTTTTGSSAGSGTAVAAATYTASTAGTGDGSGTAAGQQKQIVAVESFTNGFQQTVNAGASLTFNHTVNAGVTVLVVAVQASASSGLSTAATCYYAGLALTRVSNALSSSASTAREAAIFVLANPPVGTAQVQVPARSSGTTYTIGATAISLTGASGDVGTAASSGAASVTSISGTTVSNPGDLVITAAAIRSTTNAAGGGGTTLLKTVYGTNNAFNVNALPGGNNTSTYTWTTADQAALTSMPMAAANGAGAVARSADGTGSGDGAASAVTATSASVAGTSSGTGAATVQQRATTTTSGMGAGTGIAAAQTQVSRTSVGSGAGTGTAAASVSVQAATAGTGVGTGTATAAGMARYVRTTAGDGSGTGTSAVTGSARTASSAGGSTGTGVAVALVAASTTTNGTGNGAGTATAVIAVTASTTGGGDGVGDADANSVTYLLVVSGTSSGDGTAVGGTAHPLRDVTVTILGPYMGRNLHMVGPYGGAVPIVGPYGYPVRVLGPIE